MRRRLPDRILAKANTPVGSRSVAARRIRGRRINRSESRTAIRTERKAVVAKIGHFDNEIDMAGLAKLSGIEKINIKPRDRKFGSSGIIVGE